MPDLLHRLFTSWRSNGIRISTYFRYNSAQFDRHDQHTLTMGCKEMVYLYYKKFHIREQERVQVDNERLSQLHGTLKVPLNILP